MLPQIINSIILGIIQGISEFLPISSTGHLIIIEKILGVSQEKFGLSFDAALHLGTAFAVFWFFWPQWKKIISFKKNNKIGLYLLAATIPAALIGVVFESKIETVLRSSQIVAYGLLAGSIIIFLAEKLGKKIENRKDITFWQSIIIGISQSIALIPGISRSGITISTGMFAKLKRKDSAEFAFLLSGPIILGAGGKKLLEVAITFLDGDLTGNDILFFLVGMISAAIAGYFSIKILLKFLEHKSLNIFIIYRILLAILILLFIS